MWSITFCPDVFTDLIYLMLRFSVIAYPMTKNCYAGRCSFWTMLTYLKLRCNRPTSRMPRWNIATSLPGEVEHSHCSHFWPATAIPTPKFAIWYYTDLKSSIYMDKQMTNHGTKSQKKQDASKLKRSKFQKHNVFPMICGYGGFPSACHESKCTKHSMFGPLLEVELSKKWKFCGIKHMSRLKIAKK